MNLLKKMVGAGYKLLGMPYHIVLWTIKNSYKILKETLNYIAKGVELIIGLVLKTIKTLKKIYGDNITLVFGCGGDRDKKKRSLMAKIANYNCKKIYITDDNPRNESPNKIRKELLKYILCVQINVIIIILL